MPEQTNLPLPPEALRFMGETDESFLSIGKSLAGVLRQHGLTDEDRLLDIGCGYGRLATGLAATGFGGEYVGFDILRRQIGWCQQHLQTATDGQYQFRHLDVRNGRYNPDGIVLAHESVFPTCTERFDFASLFSVFTHFYEADVRRYLEELRRILKPGATAVTTWFLFDDDRLPAATDPGRTEFPMVNMINAVTRYSSPEDPLRAISYQQDFALGMVRDADLGVETTVRGSWCDDDTATDSFYQDVIVLTRNARRHGLDLQLDRARRLRDPSEAARMAGRARRRVTEAIIERRRR